MEAPTVQPAATAFVLTQLRGLSHEARGLERMATAGGDDAAIAAATDSFECAGGPTDTWPEEWLG